MKKRVKTFRVKAQGNSMYPILQDGDIVEYIQIPFYKIQLNDIILTYINENLVTHRVIYKSKYTCITRGDNNSTADPIIKRGRVLARVVRFKRRDTWWDIQDVYLTQSTLYLREIQKLETVLQFKKIPHVFLKGVLVSLRYEHTIPKRIYADCDILFDRRMYGNIDNIFTRLGFRLVDEDRTSFTSLKNPKDRAEISFIKLINNIPIIFDVHFEPVFLINQLDGMNLLYPKKYLAKLGSEMIDRGRKVKIKGFFYTLCSESDQILYLILHIFNHNFTDSVRYQLLISVIGKPTNRKVMKQLIETVGNLKLNGYVYPVLLLLNKYYNSPFPYTYLSLLTPSLFKQWVSTHIENNTTIHNNDARDSKKIAYIFLLSPARLGRKVLFFIHPEVYYAVFWAIRKKLRRTIFLFTLILNKVLYKKKIIL